MGGPNPPFDDALIAVITQLVQPLMQPGEQLDDLLAGVVFLGAERARVNGRDPISLDPLFILLILAACPWGVRLGPDLEQSLPAVRVQLFAGAAQNLDADRLRAAVPKSTLLLPIEAVYTLLPQATISDFLRI